MGESTYESMPISGIPEVTREHWQSDPVPSILVDRPIRASRVTTEPRESHLVQQAYLSDVVLAELTDIPIEDKHDVPVASLIDDVKRKKDLRKVMGKGNKFGHEGDEDDDNVIDGGYPTLPKELVNYRYSGHKGQMCQDCRMFVEPAGCTLVIGMIRPVDTCDRHDPKESNASFGQAGPIQAELVQTSESDREREFFTTMQAKMEQEGYEAGYSEVSPPGWEGTVLRMKQHPEVSNPWALAYYMRNKGYSPQVGPRGGKKKEARESQLVTSGSSAGAKKGWEKRKGGSAVSDTTRSVMKRAGRNEHDRMISAAIGAAPDFFHRLQLGGDAAKAAARRVAKGDKRFKVVTVPQKALRSTQGELDPARVEHYRQKPGKPGFGVLHKGKVFVADGHHRIAAELGKGASKVKMIVLRGRESEDETGTPEGAKKGWEKRKGGGGSEPKRVSVTPRRVDDRVHYIPRDQQYFLRKKEDEVGSSDGAKKGWEKRKGGGGSPDDPDAPPKFKKSKSRDNEYGHVINHGGRDYEVYFDRQSGQWLTLDLLNVSGPGGSPVDFIGHNRDDVLKKIASGDLAKKIDHYKKPKVDEKPKSSMGAGGFYKAMVPKARPSKKPEMEPYIDEQGRMQHRPKQSEDEAGTSAGVKKAWASRKGGPSKFAPAGHDDEDNTTAAFTRRENPRQRRARIHRKPVDPNTAAAIRRALMSEGVRESVMVYRSTARLVETEYEGEAGTSDGAKKGWEKRKGGGSAGPEKRGPAPAYQRSSGHDPRGPGADFKKSEKPGPDSDFLKHSNIGPERGKDYDNDLFGQVRHRPKVDRRPDPMSDPSRRRQQSEGETGTSDGAKKGWASRKSGGGDRKIGDISDRDAKNIAGRLRKPRDEREPDKTRYIGWDKKRQQPAFVRPDSKMPAKQRGARNKRMAQRDASAQRRRDLVKKRVNPLKPRRGEMMDAYNKRVGPILDRQRRRDTAKYDRAERKWQDRGRQPGRGRRRYASESNRIPIVQAELIQA
jgi:hypothetical protein